MSQLSPDPKAVARLIQSTPVVLDAMLNALDDELLSWKPAPAEWCIKEVVGHLLEMDSLAFADRIQLILREDVPSIPEMDVDQIAADRNDDKRPITELLTAFAEERARQVQFLNQLSATGLNRTGTFPVNRHFRASDFLYEWPHHDHEHIKQISDIIQAHVWPSMSTTMQTALRRMVAQ